MDSENLGRGIAAIRGDERARAAFLPVQVLDQAVFAHAYRSETTRSAARCLR